MARNRVSITAGWFSTRVTPEPNTTFRTFKCFLAVLRLDPEFNSVLTRPLVLNFRDPMGLALPNITK